MSARAEQTSNHPSPKSEHGTQRVPMPSVLLARLRNLFLTGLLVIVPIFVTLAIVKWIFDLLTGGLPRILGRIDNPYVTELLHNNLSAFSIRMLSLVLLVLGVTLMGLVARNVVGSKVIALFEQVFLRVPMVRTVYSTVRQIGHAVMAGGNNGMFRQVVMIEYPREGSYALAFVTADGAEECCRHTGEDLVGLFVPTTPNPTSGFLLLVPREDLIHLNMTVAEGMRLVISGGVVRPSVRGTDGAPAAGGPHPVAADKGAA